MENVTLTIDGQKVTVPADYNVIQAAKKLGIDIPALCYDPNLEVVGACRLCIVEIEGSRKLQTSCSTKVREGMVVHTEAAIFLFLILLLFQFLYELPCLL